jgi:hypothetical protein
VLLVCAQRVGQWLPAAFLSLLVPATTEVTVASSYLRAEAATLFQKLLSLLSKEVRSAHSALRRTLQVAPTLYSGIEVNACRSVAAQDLAAKPTAACLGPLTTVFLGALTSAKDDARRAKQALILGNAIVAFADKLPNAARKSKAVAALWGPAGSVRVGLSATAKSYVDEPSVGVQCTRMLSSLKQVRPREMSSAATSPPYFLVLPAASISRWS